MFNRSHMIALLLLPASVLAAVDVEPEARTGVYAKKLVTGTTHMVSAANHYASRAGFKILEKGGSAIDAAIATQLVLSLVEPQSSGLGGGTFIVHWDKQNDSLKSYDGREMAPSSAGPRYFLDKFGKPPRWIDAVVGGKSVGVPGLLRAMELAHKKHGKLPWKDLFTDAINLAESGFLVSPRLAALVNSNVNPGLRMFYESRSYFYPSNVAVKSGQRLRNKQFASLLKKIATKGADYFYEGTVPKAIVEKVTTIPTNPGKLKVSDFAKYEAKERQPLCSLYKQYKVCGMGPPSSGPIAIIQMLSMLENMKMESRKPDDIMSVHYFTQASKLAFADRNKYVADSDFVNVPLGSLLNGSYLKDRAKSIKPGRDMGRARAGKQGMPLAWARDNSFEVPSTTHISIVDKYGNAVSMTSSIEMAFGSGVMVNGILLNNHMTDFSLNPERAGKIVANSVDAFKRPRSSMSPIMVFNKQGDLVLVLGSPGGSRIINYVAQTMLGVLDWGMDIQSAINMPKYTNRNDYTALEKGTPIVALQTELEKMGHEVRIMDLNSGLHGIHIKDGLLYGGADPRREGKVMAK